MSGDYDNEPVGSNVHADGWFSFEDHQSQSGPGSTQEVQSEAERETNETIKRELSEFDDLVLRVADWARANNGSGGHVSTMNRFINKVMDELGVTGVTCILTSGEVDKMVTERVNKELANRRGFDEARSRGSHGRSEATESASPGVWVSPGADTLPGRSEAAKGRIAQLAIENDEAHRRSLVEAFESTIPAEYLNYPYKDYIIGSRSSLTRSQKREIGHFVDQAILYRTTLGDDNGYQMMAVSGRKNGTGKTTTAVGVAREIVSRSLCSGAFVSASDAISRASYQYDVVTEGLVTPRVLIIDDIGVSRSELTDRQKDALHFIIDQRWADPNKITILTTNMPFTSTEIERGLSDYVGRALWSRISDKLLTIEQNGDTHRGSGRAYLGDDDE